MIPAFTPEGRELPIPPILLAWVQLDEFTWLNPEEIAGWTQQSEEASLVYLRGVEEPVQVNCSAEQIVELLGHVVSEMEGPRQPQPTSAEGRDERREMR